MNVTHDDVRDLAAGFVLGALTPEEEAAVRDHLATCAEPHPELAELGGVVPHLAESIAPVEPPVELRARILAAAAAERPAASAIAPPTAPATAPAVAAPVAAPSPAPIPFPTADERSARATARPSRLATWGMGIAAVLAIAVLGAWNLQLQGRLSDVEGTLAAATAYQEGVARVLEVATQSGARTAIMATADPAASSARGLAATGPDGTVVISMHDLVPTTGTQVYEAWVIVGEAAPVPLGGFIVGEAGTGTFTGSTALAEPGAILALTLEPGPGATTPSPPVLTVGALSESG
jgi:anti-sigma-K factor RskA